MKIKKMLVWGVFISLFAIVVNAQTITMIGKEEKGFAQPRYNNTEQSAPITIRAAAKADNFPVSSSLQGSIFFKIFNEAVKRTGVRLDLQYYGKNYNEIYRTFETGNYPEGIEALFGVYYKETKYAHNKYIYPAFFINNIHIITSKENKLEIKSKADLKKYKGIRVSTDEIEDLMAREIKEMDVKEAKNFYEAYRALLTKEADFMIASYYPATIEAYKMGIRDYVSFSVGPVWKLPMFIKVTPALKRRLDRTEFSKFLGGERYKLAQEAVLKELIEIYKENTEGIVPPTFVGNNENENQPTEQ